MKIFKSTPKYTVFLLIVIILSNYVNVSYAQVTNNIVDFGDYIVVELEHGQVLQKNNSDKMTNSSLLNRLMTCLIALEKKSVTDMIIPKNDSISSTGRFRISSKNEYSVDFLIRATMLGNADNTAKTLAEHISNTEQDFVEIMNDKAKQFGMQNTYFANSDGSVNELQHTTLYDTSLFIKNAMRNQQFTNIFNLEMSLIWDAQVISNANKLVTDYSSTNTVGGVLGFFDNSPATSACTSIFYIETGKPNAIETMKLLVIVSGVKEETYKDFTENILNLIQNNYKRGLLVNEDEVVFTFKLGDEELNLISPSNVYGIVPKDLGNAVQNINFTFYEGYAPDVIKPPIKAGTILGTANYLLKDNSTIHFTIVAERDIEVKKTTVKSLLDRLKEYKEIYFLILFLFGLEIFILIMKLVSILINKVVV